MELENINAWLDVDKHSPELIRAALKEAVLAGKLSLRYIDRILFEWKKKNFTTVKQVEQHAEQFRKRTITQPQAQAEKNRSEHFIIGLKRMNKGRRDANEKAVDAFFRRDG